jgi:peptidoglycan/xylan/chitin deacetylase (PgdA/CDA1 family)
MDDLHEVFNDGHEVGNHTFDHLSALRVSPNEFLLSIDKNQKFLSGILGEHNSETFAYPFGDMNLSTKARMRNKFIASRGIFNGLNGEVAELSNLRSIGLEEKNRGKFDFSRLIPFAAEKKAWLIIFTHDVAESPSPYGCRADDLRGVLRLAMKEGLWVAPVATVLEEALAPRNVM